MYTLLYFFPLYDTSLCEQFGRVLLKSSMKNSDVNDAELPSPVGDKTGFAELEVW